MTARAVYDSEMSEREFQGIILELASYCGWIAYHTYDSRRSMPGFPDLVLVHETIEHFPIIFAEIKATSGRVSDAQKRWLDALSRSARTPPGKVIVQTWYPHDWDTIVHLLRDGV